MMTGAPSHADDSPATQSTKRILARMMRRHPGEISDSSLLFADLGLDSANVLEVLMMVEDDLKVKLDPAALEPRHLETVGSLSTYVSEQAGA